MTEPAHHELPLSGIRILDFTHMWSGPMLTRICASMGAEVLKMEAPNRADPMRFKGIKDIPTRYPDAEYGAEPHNRNAWFNTQNIDKQGLVIDAKAPRGKALLDDLIRTCDVVVANFRAGVLNKMGFGYEALRALRPDVILIEMTGYPSDSPLADLKAYGAQFEAISGSAWLMGDENAPLPTGFALGDPIGGMYGATALMTALHRRQRTGLGCHLEVPQSVTMMALMGDVFHSLSHEPVQTRVLNDLAHACPHGMFAIGAEWLSIAVYDDASWSRLAALLHAAGLQPPANWNTLAGRRADVAALYAKLQQWLDAQPSAEAAAQRLQEQGIAAGAVATAESIATNAQLHHCGFFTELDHPSAGRHAYPGLPIFLGTQARRVGAQRAAPCFGQHTREALQRLLHLSDATLDALESEQIIVDAPSTAAEASPSSASKES